MSTSSRDVPIGPPEDLKDGTKSFMVHGNPFIVPNRYDVVKAVGAGAYGVVCAARNTITKENVAIKKIPKVFDDLVDGKRILREIKLLTFLKHENIISVKEILKPRSKHFEDIYFVSELMDTDLHHIIRSKQKLTDEHHQYFIYQVLRALKYIHSAHVLHRDLKPGNLLVNGNCDLRVCDFGLARGFGADTAPQGRTPEMTDYVVTRWYRPPELLLMSSHYTAAVDMWSAGCILAELIARKPLFPGRDYVHQLTLITDCLGIPSEEDIANVKNEEAVRYLRQLPKKKPVPLAEYLPQASKLALDFLERLLTFSPNKRMTAEEALSHPYLAQLHEPSDEPSAPAPFHWAEDSTDLKEAELREEFWKEIKLHHPDLE